MCLHKSSQHWRLWLTAGLLGAAAAMSACGSTAAPAGDALAPADAGARERDEATTGATATGATATTSGTGMRGATADVVGTTAAQQQQQDRGLVPPGYGTLKQDEITVSIRNGPVLVKVTPLDEGVIRLLAPDTYQRLTALATSRRNEAARSMSRTPDLFMVSFFSYSPDISFQPEDVQLFHQARLMRPATIIPLSSGWGRQRLGQQESQSAIYAFEGPLDYTQGMRVIYGSVESNDWAQIVSKLETEKTKVLARVGGGKG